MPVLFNKATGVAENVQDAAAVQAALAKGTHEIPVVDAEGNFGSVAPQDAHEVLQTGYTQPNPEQLQHLLDKAKYEETPERVKTAAEGALNGATFGVGNIVEAGALHNSKEQLKRREINPGTHMAGQVGGIAASALTGVGVLGAVETAGVEGAAALGLGAERAAAQAAAAARAAGATAAEVKAATQAATAGYSTLGRVGSAATKAAIENMVFQAGDDASKAFMGDPQMTSTHFLMDQGLAAVIGGVLGGGGKGVGELWNATAGKKLGTLMDAIKGRAEPVPTAAEILHNTAADAANSVSGNIGAAGDTINQQGVKNTDAIIGANQNGQNAIIQGMQDSTNTLAKQGAAGTDAIVNSGIEGNNGVIQGLEDSANHSAQQGVANTDAAIGANREGQNAILQGMQDSTNAVLNKLDETAAKLAPKDSSALEFVHRLNENAAATEAHNLAALEARAGLEGPSIELRRAAGVEIPKSLDAALGDNPATRMEHALLQSGTGKGSIKVNQDLATFRENLASKVQETLHVNDTDIAAIPHISEASVGRDVYKGMQQSFQDAIDTVAEPFEKFKARSDEVKLIADDTANLVHKLVEIAQNEGWTKAPSSAEHKLFTRVLKEVPLQTTGYDLAKYASLINKETDRAELWHVGKLLRGAFREATDNALLRQLEKEGPTVVSEFATARKDYGTFINMLEQFGDRLGIRSFNGPTDFLSQLAEIARKPEDILKHMNPANDANLGKMLDTLMPDVSRRLNDYGKTELLRKSLNKDANEINIKSLGKQIRALAPEYRARILPEGAEVRLNALEHLERSIPERFNKSGTGGFIQNLLSKASPTGVGMAASLLGGPVATVMGFTLKKIEEYVGRELPEAISLARLESKAMPDAMSVALHKVEGNATKGTPDAIKIAMLKMLSSNAPTNPSGFKALVESARATVRGETKVSQAVEAVFKGGRMVISEPSKADTEKLKKHVDEIAKNPEPLLDIGNNLSHYAPEQASALSETTAHAIQYLQQLKPDSEKLGPLQGARVPSKAEESRYERALQIAQQPLVVMNAIKSGALTKTDIQHLQAMYPSLYSNLSQKIMNQVVEAGSSKNGIPYKTRLGLSTFLGQAIDSTLQQPSIAANQSASMPAQAPQAPGQQPHQGPKRSTSSLGKMPDQFALPQERRAQQRHSQ